MEAKERKDVLNRMFSPKAVEQTQGLIIEKVRVSERNGCQEADIEIDQRTLYCTQAPEQRRHARRPLLGLPLHDNGHNYQSLLRDIGRRHQRSGV